MHIEQSCYCHQGTERQIINFVKLFSFPNTLIFPGTYYFVLLNNSIFLKFPKSCQPISHFFYLYFHQGCPLSFEFYPS